MYPVDFGYQKDLFPQRINIVIPEGHKVMSIPKETGVKLPDNGGSYIYKVQHKGNQVKIFTRFQIAKNVFTSEEYFYVKELFKKIIEAEKGMIEIKRYRQEYLMLVFVSIHFMYD